MKRLVTAIETSGAAVQSHEYPAWVERRVLELSSLMFAGGLSPVGSMFVLARTSWSASLGFATAISEGLQVGEIHDREDLAHIVDALRASADVLEAIRLEGMQ